MISGSGWVAASRPKALAMVVFYFPVGSAIPKLVPAPAFAGVNLSPHKRGAGTALEAATQREFVIASVAKQSHNL